MKFLHVALAGVILPFVSASKVSSASLHNPHRNLAVPEEGAYWAIYNTTLAEAEASCIVTEGEKVDEACCKNGGEILPHAGLQGDDTCFSLGEGLIPFSGCVGDGVAEYGENCSGGDGTPPFLAADAEECGCSFVIKGSGCYKANDLPGQQWFVYLDGESCKTTSGSVRQLQGAWGIMLASLLIGWIITIV